ncbi:ribonuclease HII [Rhodohalobacter halophilus]|uniref:ribonuclease HII n=1 Tax=Rhodohalobacter halophilus TaxID=1812810 RepID=UPI00083F8E94|nr:ribonuclease HII [Rhodohalobacter halophilus]
MYTYEEKLWSEGYRRIMGLDEVGRGCLSGPVVAAGVIIKPGVKLNDTVTDSKKLSDTKRRSLAEEIKQKSEFWTIQYCTPREIDKFNILKASIRAMVKCSEQNSAQPDYLLVDGNRFTDSLIPYECVIKGDDKSASIAAASILAKVYRDDWMVRLHEEFPHYGWDSNVGYPTKVHYEGLSEFGFTEHHRRSFKLRTNKPYDARN